MRLARVRLDRLALVLFIGAVVSTAAPQASRAADILVSAPELPPQVNESGGGREADSIRAILEACGHSVRFQLAPFGRHWRQYADRERFDAVTTVPPGMELPGHASPAYIRYQNGASVLEGSGLRIESVDDLEGLRIVTFEDGVNILGLQDQVERFKDIEEVANQVTHSRLLFRERVDAVLSDGLIFAEFNRRLRQSDAPYIDADQQVIFHAIFPPTPYRMVFRDQGLRDDFARCHEQLEADGTLEAINERYVSRYRETVGSDYLGY
jgi:ABC-type amino acid transport substrate-binding protein